MATTKRTRTSAKKWEYALVPIHPNLLGLLKGSEEEPREDDPGLRPLNLMGDIGWEAVGFAPNPGTWSSWIEWPYSCRITSASSASSTPPTPKLNPFVVGE